MDIPIPALSLQSNMPTDRARQATPQAARDGAGRTESASEQIARQSGEPRAGRDPLRQTEASRSMLEARIKFEYEQSHRVMKLHDSKGVLIYQVPPQGALQLILQEEARSAQLQDSA